jgi:short-subunit dehydrogenase
VAQVFPSIGLPRSGALAVDLDVTASRSISGVVNVSLTEFGRIDVLVINAPLYSPDSKIYDDHELTTMRAYFEANLVGIVALVCDVVGVMRRQASGHIFLTTPFVAMDTAAHSTRQLMVKHALEGWSNALGTELEPLGISVTFVETQPLTTRDDAERAAKAIQILARKGRTPGHIVLGQTAYDIVLEQMSARLLEVASSRPAEADLAVGPD